jgi:hypothetical protein
VLCLGIIIAESGKKKKKRCSHVGDDEEGSLKKETIMNR